MGHKEVGERVLQPKSILVVRGPRNASHETDLMQESYWGWGGYKVDDSELGWKQTAADQVTMEGAEHEHRENKATVVVPETCHIGH